MSGPVLGSLHDHLTKISSQAYKMNYYPPCAQTNEEKEPEKINNSPKDIQNWNSNPGNLSSETTSCHFKYSGTVNKGHQSLDLLASFRFIFSTF